MDNNSKIEYELDNDARNQMSIKKQGKNNPNWGKVTDPRTAEKISNSLKKYHQNKKAFEQASKLSCTKRIWYKERFQGFIYFSLQKCSDSCGLYNGFNLKTKEQSYRVYYFFNNNEEYKDFDDYKQADEFYNLHTNPHVDYIISENKNKVVVLGFLTS